MTQRASDPDDGSEDGTNAPYSAGPFSGWGKDASAELTPPPVDDAFPTAATYTDEDPGTSDPGLLPSDSRVGVDPELGPHDSIGIQGPPQPGQVLFGRYRAEKMIGEGGMGTVWLVKHLELDTLRALKLIVSGIAFDPQAQARFKREARVMARLSHPNAVVVHDARMARDAAFIEMEFIRGQSLNKKISTGVPLPLDWTARILEQLCDVLIEAHAQKIVHRDLKPANLMLVDGRPVGKEHLKVLDFGIAKILEGDGEGAEVHTHTGCFLGSAPYSSPEQATNGTVDVRSDLYSVGVILYELLTGHRPFTGPITRLIYDHVYSLPAPFAEKNPAAKVPAAVEAVVRRCLAKNPADRPQSAAALVQAFREALPEGIEFAPGIPPGLLPGLSGVDVATQANTEADPDLGPERESLTSQSQARTDDGQRIRYRPDAGLGSAEAKTERGTSFAKPSPLEKPAVPLVDTGFGAIDVVLPETETEADADAERERRRRRRKWIAVVVLATIGAALVATAVVQRVRRGAPPLAPDGYTAEDPHDLIDGAPRVLVRRKDRVRFLRIVGGSFKMGNGFDPTGSDRDDDQPAHPVVLSDFYLQETEVTNAQILAYFETNHVAVEARPTTWRNAYKKIEKAGRVPDNYPAVGIPYELAEKFARSLGARLPTEAQWEYAARSRGHDSAYVWGNEPKADKSRANIETLGSIEDIPTFEVGKYPKDRTEQGLFDMTGNVREWCRDVWSRYPESLSATPTRDPQGPIPAKAARNEHVIRGGSFALFADTIRTTRPRHQDADLNAPALDEEQAAVDLGFRVAIEWPRKP